jgi:hypothetical protein
MITLYAALLGAATPIMTVIAGNETLSSAIVPLIFWVLIIYMTLRSSARIALYPAAAAARAPKPPPRPPAFRPEDV